MEIDKKLIARRHDSQPENTVRARQLEVGMKRDPDLLSRAMAIYQTWDSVRRSYARCNRFTYEDQWGDTIEINGKTTTYRKYLQQEGNVVLQTNQIKNKVDTIAGVVVKEQNGPICIARDNAEQQFGEIVTEALKANCQKNDMEALYIKYIKELCLGGVAVNYESWDNVSNPTGEFDTWSTPVELNTLILDSGMSDPRGWDIHFVGRFFDMDGVDLLKKFAHSADEREYLRRIYPGAFDINRRVPIVDATKRISDMDREFLYPEDRSKCRVFEIWTKESRPCYRMVDTNDPSEELIVEADDYVTRKAFRAENQERMKLWKASGQPMEDCPYIIGDGFGRDKSEKNGFFYDTFWYCRMLAPDGTILWEGESPFPDKSHPFTFCVIPLIGGKVSGYMTDAIDHNIAMNRALVLHDWLQRVNAKGVTVVPKAIVPKDISFEDFADSWTSIDDMVFIDMDESKKDLFPKVFFGQSHTFDVSQQLQTLSQLMENSTAVNGALQGKTPGSGTSGSLYAQMTANSSTPIAALLAQFHEFLQGIHTKKLKNILHFYDIRRFERIAGDIGGILDNENLNLSQIGSIEYDLAVKESTDSPTYKAMYREDLKNFLLNKLIDMDEYLEFSDEPWAQKMLQNRQARRAEAQAAMQAAGGMPTEASGAPSVDPDTEVVQGAQGLAPDVLVKNGRAVIDKNDHTMTPTV